MCFLEAQELRTGKIFVNCGGKTRFPGIVYFEDEEIEPVSVRNGIKLQEAKSIIPVA